VILGEVLFDIAWWMSVLAVLITFVLSIVAARATGETDITPITALGKVTQLTYGAIAPSNIATNLMTASITAGASAQSADLLTDLKAGYLLGTNPRRQSVAQFFGVLAGVLVCAPIYAVIVKTPAFDPNLPASQVEHAHGERGYGNETNSPAEKVKHAHGPPAVDGHGTQNFENQDLDTPANSSTEQAAQTNLLTKEFPAPSALVWKSVAEILAKGVKELPKGSVIGMIIGGILGILIAIAEEVLPKRYVKWIPSATGLGIAGVIPALNSISMFLGAFLAWIWLNIHRRSAEDYTVSGASGMIAGESLTGVTINIWQAAPTLGPAIWRFFFG
jgi:uncharacterized oligopeptide transporter (OPT) family protein